ncbi:MAG: prolipoprotein diacylglyceryl transferase [Anaerolineaceae bacterium 4572_5.1]|nr:MAG: prolipoprotein diacylglyceryl transferase [Anaerolineaceae bacterium 4572_5.1]
MDPIIFRIPGTNFALHWYGLMMAGGIILAGYIAEWGVRRYGEKPERIWDLMIWAVPTGVVGARLWYVLNDILGGGTYFIDHPASILKTWEGGLHFYGAVLGGALGGLIYIRRHKLDMRLFLDAAAPALLIAQAVVRPANFINQELYGQPTTLPWGISIDAAHRISPWTNMLLYPVKTTRFHPTFAYEILWNLLAAGVLAWLTLQFTKKIKPGSVFAGWLVLEGVGRELIEFFRPDQPRIPGTDISITRIAAGIMVIVGIVILLVKYEIIRVPFLKPGSDSYKIAPAQKEEKKA